MSDKEVTVRVFQFSSSEKWLNWKAVFLARLNKKDASMAAVFDLQKEFKMTKTENGTEVPDEEQEKLMASAYTELLLSMNFNSREGENAFNLVKWSKDNEGRGNAREAWKRLIERYEPKTYLEKGKLMREFFSLSCGHKEDPVQFVYQLENIRLKIHEITEGKEVISDKDFMNQVLNSLPSAYDSLAENLLAMVDQDKDPLTISNMIQELSEKCAKLKTGKRGNKGNNEEIALIGFNNQFKGKCSFCGKIGHKSVDCFEKKKKGPKSKPQEKFQAKKGKFVPTCYNCGEKGHKKPDCPKLTKKQDSNHALAAMDEDIAFPTFEEGWKVVTHKKRKAAKNTCMSCKTGHTSKNCYKNTRSKAQNGCNGPMDSSDDDRKPAAVNYDSMSLESSESESTESEYSYHSSSANSTEYMEDSDSDDEESAYISYDSPWDEARMLEAESEVDSDEREAEVARIMVDMYDGGLEDRNNSESSDESSEANAGLQDVDEDQEPRPDLVVSYHLKENSMSSFLVNCDKVSGEMTIVRVSRR